MAATSLAPVPAQRTTTEGRVRANGPVLHARLVAVVTAVSCAAHLWLAASGGHGVWVSIVMLVLAAVCVPCAVHIWRHCTADALHKVSGTALVMVAVHTALLLGAGGAGHAHAGTASTYNGDNSANAQLLLVIAVEMATAMLTATLVARLRHRGRTMPHRS